MTVNSPLLAAALALTAATCWGTGDFTGGLASRRFGPLRSVLISYTLGLCAMVILAAARPEAFPSFADLGWGRWQDFLGWLG